MNIVGGAPPPEFAKHAPHVDRAALAKLEKAMMAHLAAHPRDAARFLSDPVGILRKVAPKQTKLIGAVASTRAAKPKVVPAAADGQIEELKVTVGKRRAKPRVPRQPKPSR